MTQEPPLPLHPVLATWKEGRRVLGRASAPAEELWARGEVPVWGLAATPAPDLRLLASVEVDDELAVERRERGWVVLDEAGQVMGWLRWKPGYDGQKHAVTGVTMRLPTSGVLLVERLVLDESDRVVDIGGVVSSSVEPESGRDEAPGRA